MRRNPPMAFLAALIVGPYLQDLRPDGVLVSFETDAPSAAAVEVGPDASFGEVVSSPTTGTHHDVRLSGLAAGTAWHYRVRVDGQPAGEPGTFVTAPEPGSDGPLTFLVAGDNRSDANAHALVVSRMTEHEAEFVVNTGDMVSSGEVASQWVQFFEIEAPLVRDTPIYPTVGNHDEDGGELPEPYLRLFAPPPGSGHDSYYSFDHGNCRFIVVDGYVEVDDEWSCLLKILNWGKCFDQHQSEWLEATLKDAAGDPDVEHVFVFTHEGPYSSKPGRSGSPQMRRLLDLFSVNKVRVVISGHDHYYEHGVANNGLPYVITGGGGAPLYETNPGVDLLHPHQVLVSTSVHNFLRVFVHGPYVEVTAYDATGAQIDRFEIGGKPECSNAADCNDGEPGPCAGKWSCGADSKCAWVCDPPPPCLTVLDCGVPPLSVCPGHWQCLGSCAWTCDSSGECGSDLDCESHPPLNDCEGGFYACVDDVCEWNCPAPSPDASNDASAQPDPVPDPVPEPQPEPQPDPDPAPADGASSSPPDETPLDTPAQAEPSSPGPDSASPADAPAEAAAPSDRKAAGSGGCGAGTSAAWPCAILLVVLASMVPRRVPARAAARGSTSGSTRS